MKGRRLISAILIMCIVFFNMQSAFATEHLGEKQNNTSEILKNISSEKNFDLDKEVTINEFCYVLTKVFYPEEEIKEEDFGEWYTPYVNFWIDKHLFSAYDHYKWEECYINAASIIDMILVVGEYYNRPLEKLTYLEKISKTAYDCGLVPEDYDCSQKMTMREMLLILSQVVDEEFQQIEYSGELPVEYELHNFRNMDETFKKCKEYLSLIPEKYIREFNEKGYKFIMSKSCEELFYSSEGNLVGVYEKENKAIYVERDEVASTVFHEFGHFIAYELIPGRKMILRRIFEKEGKSISKYTSIYALESEDECFAEAFAWLLSNRKNSEKIAKFREANPLATAIILDNIIEYDGLVNIKQIKRLVNNCY